MTTTNEDTEVNNNFEYPGAIIEDGNTINDTESIENILIQEEWVTEAKQIPADTLTIIESNILHKCINKEPMDDNEIKMLQKILAKYRPAIQKIQPAKKVERVQENIDIVNNEKEFLKLVDEYDTVQTLPFNYPVGDKTIHVLFDVYPITDSEAILDIAQNLSFFQDFTDKEKEVYTKIQEGATLTREEKIIQENLSKQIEALSQQNTEETITLFLASQLKFHNQDTSKETMIKVIQKIQLAYRVLLFEKVQEMSQLPNLDTEKVFHPFN